MVAGRDGGDGVADGGLSQVASYVGKRVRGILCMEEGVSTEHDKWRSQVAPYLTGNGIELATGGSPIVPHSIQFELTEESYRHYNGGQSIRGVVHWRDDKAIWVLPFKDGVLDYVAA